MGVENKISRALWQAYRTDVRPFFGIKSDIVCRKLPGGSVISCDGHSSFVIGCTIDAVYEARLDSNLVFYADGDVVTVGGVELDSLDPGFIYSFRDCVREYLPEVLSDRVDVFNMVEKLINESTGMEVVSDLNCNLDLQVWLRVGDFNFCLLYKDGMVRVPSHKTPVRPSTLDIFLPICDPEFGKNCRAKVFDFIAKFRPGLLVPSESEPGLFVPVETFFPPEPSFHSKYCQ